MPGHPQTFQKPRVILKFHVRCLRRFRTESQGCKGQAGPLRGGGSPSALRRPREGSFCEAFAKGVRTVRCSWSVCVALQMWEYLLSELSFLNKYALGHSFLPHSFTCLFRIR